MLARHKLTTGRTEAGCQFDSVRRVFAGGRCLAVPAQRQVERLREAGRRLAARDLSAASVGTVSRMSPRRAENRGDSGGRQ
jgi:hypothetical protein